MADTWGQMERLTGALSELRIAPGSPEAAIHQAIAAALSAAAIPFAHEAKLAPRCRVDFLVGDIAIEVKCGKPQRGPLLEQLRRYMAQPQVRGLLLVVERNAPLPRTIGGKPCMLFGLNRLWGVALR